jgi:hypothetical protein
MYRRSRTLGAAIAVPCARSYPRPDCELHGAESHRTRSCLRVFAHGGCNAFALRFGGNDVAAIAHVRAQLRLVRFDEVGAGDRTRIVDRDEGSLRQRNPCMANIVLAILWIERIGVARTKHVLQNLPSPCRESVEFRSLR